jgi:hypothetical protein
VAGFGAKGQKTEAMVSRIASDLGVKNFLDYGAGKCTLAQVLPQFVVDCYDPAIPGLDDPPEPHRLVVCTDVLEHIEPEHIRDVIADLARVTQEVLYVTIHTAQSLKTLADGRNAHLSQHPVWWWVRELDPYFDLVTVGLYNFVCSGIFQRRKR